MDLQELYKIRFDTVVDSKTLEKKNAIWKVLCDMFFTHYVPNGATIVDIGAGYCEFINNICVTSRERERERGNVPQNCRRS